MPPRPISALDLLDAIGMVLQDRMAARDVSRTMNGVSQVRDREVRCLEMVAEIVYNVSCDRDGYRDFAKSVAQKYPRWRPPGYVEPAPAEGEPTPETPPDDAAAAQ